MSSSADIIAPLDNAQLQSQGLISPPNDLGQRRMHKRRLNRSSDEEHDNIPLNVSFRSPDTQGAFMTIPDQLISRASLEYVGFSFQKATELWDRWTHWPTGPYEPIRETDPDDGTKLEMTFIDFITGPFVGSRNVAHDSDSDWLDCMTYYGLNLDTQRAIMEPAFKVLRLSMSCGEWCEDTIRMRYAGLVEIQAESLNREQSLRHSDAHTSGSGATESQSTSGQASTDALASNHPHASSYGSLSALSASRAPGSVVLYKGLDKGRITNLLNDDGSLRELSSLQSASPNDFFSRAVAFYFTPNLDVAEYYAAWAKRRSITEEVVIVSITIPNSAIEQMQEPIGYRLYWPSDDWKKLIWNCLRGQKHPRELRKYRHATLIIGTTSKRPSLYYHTLDYWEQVSERCVLKMVYATREVIAIQYCFSGHEGGDFLEENITNIQVVPFRHPDMEGLLRRHDIVMA